MELNPAQWSEPPNPWASLACATLQEFVATINNTGGVIRSPIAEGLYGCVADPEWIDLGAAYIKACRVLGIEPHIAE